MNKFQQAGRVKVIKGSILNPENAGLRFVLSVNNTAGKPDNHPLYPLFEKKWKKVKEDAKGWYATKTGAYKLGATNVTAVQSDTWVIHMLCQDDNLQTDLKALDSCLKKVTDSAKYEKASVHVSNLLIKSIPELSEMLTNHLVKNGVSVSYYEEE
jgi:hypothetical protein